MISLYRPLISLFVRFRLLAVALAVSMLLVGLVIFPKLGSEFVPRLNEGDLLVRVTMAPSIALEEAKEVVLRFERRLLSKFPEVERVVTRVGTRRNRRACRSRQQRRSVCWVETA